MEVITLSDNVSAEVELRLIRDSSLITMGFTPRIPLLPYIKYLANLIMKETIIRIILEDRCIYQDEAKYECCKKIAFDFFNEVDFLKLFMDLKEVSERKTPTINRNMIKLSKIYWPSDVGEQMAAIENIYNFELFFEKRHSNSKLKIFLSSNIRMFLIKILKDNKVLEKESTRCFCKNSLRNDYNDVLFDENWLYLQNVFSMQKS